MKTKITINLTREKAIEMLCNENCQLNLNIDITGDTAEEDLNSFLDFDYEIGEFKDDCRATFKKVQDKKKELNKLMTHEIYELGEKEDLWHLSEKQKKLNLK